MKEQIMNNNASSDRTAAVRKLNDRLRTTLSGGVVLLTAGIVALDEIAQARVLAAVRAFDAFTEDNDPWGEHDFGSLDVVVTGATDQPHDTLRVLFKVDYYDPLRARHSADPADATKTERVLTIMLASEY